MDRNVYLWLARLLLAGLVVFALFYPYRFFGWAIPFAFSGPEGWQSHWLVEDHVRVPFGVRLGHFLMWMPTVLATQAMIFAAIWFTVLILRGALFERRTVLALQWVGLCAALTSATALAALPFDGWILTRYNTDHVRGIRFYFDSGEIGVLLVGLGVFLLGRVLMVTVILDRENREFV